VSWIRRRTRKEEPPANRLPGLEFLALVRAGLEEFAPGVTQGAQLKGNSLISPQGWAVAVAPPHHGGGHHYDLVALPDVGLQPDVPCFVELDRHGAELLFQVLTEREEKNSVAIASNESFGKAHMFRRTRARQGQNFTGSGSDADAA
jgi:hypothetical protein